MAINRIYCATGITGGTEGCLDTIKYGALTDKDMACVIDQTNVYFFVWDEDNETAESTPWTTNRVVEPDDVGAYTGAWVLLSFYAEDFTLIVDDINVGMSVSPRIHFLF